MLIYFNEVILNIDPFAIKKLPFEAKRVTFHNYNNAIKTKIKEILDKKERCKFFI